MKVTAVSVSCLCQTISNRHMLDDDVVNYDHRIIIMVSPYDDDGSLETKVSTAIF